MVIIAIEGIDGSGKGTHAKRVEAKLKELGKTVTLFSFPRYQETEFGAAVGEYLNGDFGKDVHPKLASVLYAVDRFESRGVVRAHNVVQDVVVCDRYVPSNLAHQCAKICDCDPAVDEGMDLFRWILEMEHKTFNLPRPDMVICLDLPVKLACKLIELKRKRAYTDKKADLHEADHKYLEAVRRWYQRIGDELLYVPKWRTVNVHEDDEIRPVDDVFEDVWAEVSSVLPS